MGRVRVMFVLRMDVDGGLPVDAFGQDLAENCEQGLDGGDVELVQDLPWRGEEVVVYGWVGYGFRVEESVDDHELLAGVLEAV